MFQTIADELRIRDARPEEAPVLSALALRSKGMWGYSEAFLEACRAELSWSPAIVASPDRCFRCAERNGVLAGFHALGPPGLAEVELDALFVAPEWVRTGVGQALFADAVIQAKERGVARILIQGDPHAVSFYERVGCRQIGERESGSVPGRMLPLFDVVL